MAEVMEVLLMGTTPLQNCEGLKLFASATIISRTELHPCKNKKPSGDSAEWQPDLRCPFIGGA